ncbi:MAG: HIRAN domain-containing protein [Verrucomicrobiales bacterium]|nr:HIRAN domain-containing protein [Verrucomicrobiales bacterium]
MHGSFGANGALLPFTREIMLIECHIAGTGYRGLQEIEPGLLPGAFLPLKREPDNSHDPLAIMILDESGHHLGYVPRAKNEALARLMDAGKLLFARLEKKEWSGQWLNADVRVYLRDV